MALSHSPEAAPATAAQPQAQPHTDTNTRTAAQRFYFAVWRWHFYAGLYVVPFLIMLAATGLAMMYIAFFDGREGEYVTVPAPTSTTLTLSVEQQAQIALDALPGGALVEWIAPKYDLGAGVVRVAHEGAQKFVAVNPFTGEVVDIWQRRQGWYDFMSDIHGELLIGVTGDRMIEVAASLSMILIVTGLYLWWPRGTSAAMFIPNLRAKGRAWWKSLHAVVGFYISALLVVFMLSGLAWAGIWGGKFVQPWNSFPEGKWGGVAMSDTTHASMNHGAMKDVPWTLELLPLPESGSTAGTQAIPSDIPVNGDSVFLLADALGYEGRIHIHFPKSETGVYTISQDSMSNDSACATCDRTVHIDQYTGKILMDLQFADYPALGKAMAVGISFHEGDMGLWNLVLNTVFCLAVIFVCVSGIVMWLKRRPSGAARLAAPPAPAEVPILKGAVLLGLFCCLAFPLAGVTLLAVLVFDFLILNTLPPLKRLFS